ncbi:MAG: LemA family protein [Bdellovibrionales bacterium]|nr:LemA family protein [Bdellovibrionales bacterium]
MAIALGIFLALVLITIIFTIAVYNRLIALRNQFKNAFSQIDVQLKRRHDLIPNLVETAKAYMEHEKETLEAVIAARNIASQAQAQASKNPTDASAVQKLIKAESSLGGMMGRLFAVVEKYPELKANQNLMQLAEEISSTENKISFARQAYNDVVMTYNNRREVFPNNMVAGLFSFRRGQMFEIEDPASKEVPKVSF